MVQLSGTFFILPDESMVGNSLDIQQIIVTQTSPLFEWSFLAETGHPNTGSFENWSSFGMVT
jgi:hypothetical protein